MNKGDLVRYSRCPTGTGRGGLASGSVGVVLMCGTEAAYVQFMDRQEPIWIGRVYLTILNEREKGEIIK